MSNLSLNKIQSEDFKTSQAFSYAFSALSVGSIYTKEQVADILYPINQKMIENKDVLEMGCGNGSILQHIIDYKPNRIVGVELGDSYLLAQKKFELLSSDIDWKIINEDLLKFNSTGFDFVFCIGVLHHMKTPFAGFQAVLKNTKSGGHFHCWVYAKEGTLFVRIFIEPLRKLCQLLPKSFVKYLIASPLAIPFYLYSKMHKYLGKKISFLPLSKYVSFLSERNYSYFRYVALDQLITPQTTFIKKSTIESWLASDARIKNKYIIFRNGNSWTFGGYLN